MRRGKTQSVVVCLFLLTAVFGAIPARAQIGERGSVGLEAGETSDKFGAIVPVKSFEGGIEGELAIIKTDQKSGIPNILIGGEIRFPSDTSKHASEFAAYGGPQFRAGSHFSLGFRVQIRKIFLPPGDLNGVTFNRDKMLMLELPVVLEYKSGADRGVFFQVQGSPEFTPRLKYSIVTTNPPPHPSFDHGYTARASLGYNFGKWYAKGTYQRRFLKFKDGISNPLDVYNWRSDQITGGFGLVF